MLEPLSLKQRHSLKNSTARLNFWEGSVRSGKSFSALIRFVEFAMSPIIGDFCVIGKTEDALKRNVISELSHLIGSDVRYYSGKREIRLWNRTIHVIGANDDRAEGKIRGATFAGALVDEGTLIPEPFFKMLLSRLSVRGSKLFCTTNPDSPFHWMKTDYLDREDELDLARFHFVLDDNPALSDEYKNSLKAEYRGLWYQRFIEGLWVLAEGTIFDFFEEDLHMIHFPPKRSQQYVVGIDYGTVNPTYFALIGYDPDGYPNLWTEKEYVWDSKAHNRQKTDSEYADDLIKFIEGYPISSIRIDPSAASFIAECHKKGIGKIQDANNDVLSGIRFMSQLMTEGTWKICSCCKHLRKEIETYVWDEKAALRGKEQPRKVNDHGVDANRYGLMHFYTKGQSSLTPQALKERFDTSMNNGPRLPGFFSQNYYST